MYLLICLGIFWFFPLTLALEEDSPLDCVPRKSVSYQGECFCLCVTALNCATGRVGTHTWT